MNKRKEILTRFLNVCAYQYEHYRGYTGDYFTKPNCVVCEKQDCVWKLPFLDRWLVVLDTMSCLPKVCFLEVRAALELLLPYWRPEARVTKGWLLNCWIFTTCPLLLVVAELALEMHSLLRRANSFPTTYLFHSNAWPQHKA